MPGCTLLPVTPVLSRPARKLRRPDSFEQSWCLWSIDRRNVAALAMCDAPLTLPEVAVRLSAAVLAFVVLFGLAGCDPGTGNGTRRVACQVTVDDPVRDNDQSPQRILTRVRYWCARPGADRLSIPLRVQLVTHRGNCMAVATRSVPVRRGQTIRRDAAHSRTVQISVPCAPGVYRALVTGRSVAGRRTKNYKIATGRAFDPCRPGM